MLEAHFKSYLDKVKKAAVVPTDAEMRKAFSAAGWSAGEIDEAIAYVKGVSAPAPIIPPPPKPVEPPQSVQPLPSSRPAIPPAAPVTREVNWPTPTPPVAPKPAPAPAAPLAPQPAPSFRAPVAPQPTPAPQSYIITPPAAPAEAPRGGRGSRVLFLVLALLVLIGGGVAYAYIEKLGPFYNPPFDSTNLAVGALESELAAKSYKYEGSLVVEAAPRDSDLEPLDLNLGEEYSFFTIFPALDFKFEMKNEGGLERQDGSPVASRVHLTGSGSGFGMSGSFDVELVQKDTDIYVKLSKIPSIPFVGKMDLSAIANKWVKISRDDLLALGGTARDLEEIDQFAKLDLKQLEGEARVYAQAVDASGIFYFKNPPRGDAVNGASAYRYDLGISLDGLIKFMVQLYGPGFDQDEINDIKQDPYFTKAFEYVNKNSTLHLWFDAETKHLVKTEYSFRGAVADIPAFDSKQIVMKGSFARTGINEPVDIGAPTDTMPFEDAYLAYMGISKEEHLLSTQESQIEGLRFLLTLYYDKYSKYPQTLQDLSEVSFSNQSIPQDVILKAPYLYFPAQKDYKLQYEIKLPEYTPKIDRYSIGSYVDRVWSSKYISGKNTATAKILSTEAAALSKKDTDKDGVTDLLEDYIGTSKTEKDTDGDGTSDFFEFDSPVRR